MRVPGHLLAWTSLALFLMMGCERHEFANTKELHLPHGGHHGEDAHHGDKKDKDHGGEKAHEGEKKPETGEKKEAAKPRDAGI